MEWVCRADAITQNQAILLGLLSLGGALRVGLAHLV